jgi:hypothetical protein
MGLDVHQPTISVAVLDFARQVGDGSYSRDQGRDDTPVLRGLRGSLHVTFEEGTWAAWLHDLIKPHVAQQLVCDPRKNTLGKVTNKNDRNDARELAELLWRAKLTPVYHGEEPKSSPKGVWERRRVCSEHHQSLDKPYAPQMSPLLQTVRPYSNHLSRHAQFRISIEANPCAY